jgi:hypothetical protein
MILFDKFAASCCNGEAANDVVYNIETDDACQDRIHRKVGAQHFDVLVGRFREYDRRVEEQR